MRTRKDFSARTARSPRPSAVPPAGVNGKGSRQRQDHRLHAADDRRNSRRRIQQQYNRDHGITPRPIQKAINLNSLLAKASESPQGAAELVRLSKENGISAQAADEKFLSGAELKKRIDSARREMEKAAKNLDFISAAAWRDEMERLKALSAEK